MFRQLFTAHPARVGETYVEHMAVASGFGWAMAKASCACFVHALVPGLCERTGSRIILDLHGRMVTNRHPATPAEKDACLWLAANI
jgi:hypothetical protein